MKHLYSLSLLLLALMLPATAIAHDFEVDGIYYKINGNEVTMTYRGNYPDQYSNEYSGSVTIPATVTYNGTTYSVTTIDDYAFYNCSGLTSITIGNSVKSIGISAFYNCSGLTSITIPNSVTKIGSTAFYGCTSLTSIDIPNSVTSIGNEAFFGTAWFNNQPDGLVYAGLVAYKYKGTMSNGTSIIIRDGTRGIAGYAFYNCRGLTSIDISNTVTFIGNEAFSHCSGLTSIKVASGSPTYDSRGNCNAIIETASNTLILGCKYSVIPNSVASIGDWAFSGCSGLTSINIPNSITSIGNSAFSYCTSLTSVTIGNSVTTINDFAFSGCTGLTSIDIPNSVTTIGGAAFSGCSGLTSITIPNSVTTIGNEAFSYCSGLTSINIPNSVTTIGKDAFFGTAWFNNQRDGVVYASLVAYKYKGTMPSGTIITLRDGTLGIAVVAFEDCSGLTSITIPNSVTSIGNSAFSYCTSLTSITIPNSVTSIGQWAFSYCSSLTSITIPNSITSIADYTFIGCTGLTSIDIPNSVTSIGSSAFYGCSGLTEIYSLALTPPTIYYYTFTGGYGATLYVPNESVNAYKAANYWKNFTNIVGVIIPGTSFEVNGIYYLVTDENSVFVTANETVESYYSGNVVIPDSVTYSGQTFAVTGIEGNAFDGCFELTSITIPNSVETIGEQAFQGCTGLKSVTIGSGVTAIGAKAFNYCNALETVKCLGTVPPVMASADCFSTAAYNRATLLVPRNTEATYTAADYWYKFAHIEGWGSAGRGDIDGDGVVSIRDVTTLIDAILNGNNEGVYFESADVNSNGRLDIGDVTTIVDMLLNDIE